MKLSVHCLRTNEWTHNEEEVPEGTSYGFWRVVEHTGAGWFPWPEFYEQREDAERAMARALAREASQ